MKKMYTDSYSEPDMQQQGIMNKAPIKKQVNIGSIGQMEVYRGERPTPLLQPVNPPHSLVGRDKILEDLTYSFLTDDASAFWTLWGQAGIGKTALAAVFANEQQILDAFADGILWVELGEAFDPAELLHHWMGELGIYDMITTPEDQMDLIQGVIGHRRMLIVLDDVRHLEDALWFKIGGPRCMYLLTTRDEDIAREFAGQKNSIVIQALREEESLELLKQFAQFVVERYQPEMHALIQAAEGVPLDLILIGKYLQKEAASQQSRRILQALEDLKELAQQKKLAAHFETETSLHSTNRQHP